MTPSTPTNQPATEMKSLLASFLCVLISAWAYPAQPTKEELKSADRTIDILTKAHNATRRLSYADGLALIKFAELNHELNLAAGPILRDISDPGIDAEAWLRRNREGMVQCASKILQMKTKIALLDDLGAKASVTPIQEGNEEFFSGLRHIQNCYAGSPGNPNDGLTLLRSGIKKRKEAGLPIIKKLRDLFGAEEFDKSAVKILEETARATSR
jgi:hypothetical protein